MAPAAAEAAGPAAADAVGCILTSLLATAVCRMAKPQHCHESRGEVNSRRVALHSHTRGCSWVVLSRVSTMDMSWEQAASLCMLCTRTDRTQKATPQSFLIDDAAPDSTCCDQHQQPACRGSNMNSSTARTARTAVFVPFDWTLGVSRHCVWVPADPSFMRKYSTECTCADVQYSLRARTALHHLGPFIAALSAPPSYSHSTSFCPT